MQTAGLLSCHGIFIIDSRITNLLVYILGPLKPNAFSIQGCIANCDTTSSLPQNFLLSRSSEAGSESLASKVIGRSRTNRLFGGRGSDYR